MYYKLQFRPVFLLYHESRYYVVEKIAKSFLNNTLYIWIQEDERLEVSDRRGEE